MDRSRIRREYKESPPDAGIFAVRNQTNGRLLLGRSPNVRGALNRARFQLGVGSHQNVDLQGEWEEYGADSFVFEVLESVDPNDEKVHDLPEELRVLEELWLEQLKPYGKRGYNAPPKVDG